MIMTKRVKCFRCKRVYRVEVPDWMTYEERISCPNCDEEIRIYPDQK